MIMVCIPAVLLSFHAGPGHSGQALQGRNVEDSGILCKLASLIKGGFNDENHLPTIHTFGLADGLLLLVPNLLGFVSLWTATSSQLNNFAVGIKKHTIHAARGVGFAVVALQRCWLFCETDASPARTLASDGGSISKQAGAELIQDRSQPASRDLVKRSRRT
jgi:hypothetical protein